VSVLVFSGPTIAPAEAAQLLPEARCLEPAAQGDVWLACRERPAVICLIDGYFEHVPAVTHKELLWALQQGIRVYGAASLGALRAVELSPFGMVGHGAIYQAFACGELEDDDEVAVAHTDAADGFRAVSEALVNLRATLARARQLGVLSALGHDRVVAAAKRLFYPDRTLARAIDESELEANERSALSTWARERSQRVDQKRVDAESLLRHVQGELGSSTHQPAFVHTHAWEHIVRENRGRAGVATDTPGVIEEVQLLGPEVFSELLFAATRRALALCVQPALRHQELDDAAVERAHLLALEQLPRVLAELGDLERVRERARHKRQVVQDEAQLATDRELAEFFSERLSRALPDDLEDYAASVGLGSTSLLRAAVWRELRYLRR